LAAVLSGCETVDVNYMGKTAAPTAAAAVFYDKKDVPDNAYTVMGKAIVTAPEDISGKNIEARIVQEAEKQGADAVLIGEAREVATGETTDWATEGFGPFDEYEGWGWGFGPATWECVGPVRAIGPVDTVYNYSLKIKVLFLKKK